MLVSTFELLVKRQLPKEITDANGNLIPLSRPIVQAYFLTIANITENPVNLILNFKAVTAMTVLPDITATFLDTNGVNLIGDVIPEVNNAYKYPIDLDASTTCLFILQPDIINNKQFLTDLNVELRGYVDIELAPGSPNSSVQLLITPEHRGTFFRSGITNNTPRSDRQLGEISYSLPTASGGSLFTLER